MKTVHNLKFIVLGDPEVGKTQMCRALKYNESVKISSGFVQVSSEEQVKIEMQDSVGTHLPPSYLKGAICCLLLYDTSRSETLEHVRSWFDIAIETSSSQMLSILVGNSQPGSERAVSIQEGEGLANELGILHFDVEQPDQALNVIEFAAKDIYTGVQSGKFQLDGLTLAHFAKDKRQRLTFA